MLSLENQLEKERFNGLIDRFHSHSVFNALEHIRYLVRIKESGVERYILDYSTLLLDDLRHSPHELYPLMEQWDYVQNYLQLQNLKHREGISIGVEYQENLQQQLRTLLLPWKLWFPLVENAFKHARSAMDQMEAKPVIQVWLELEKSHLLFKIRNSYSNLGKPAGSGQGIINMKKRLNLLYPNGNWKLEQSNDGHHWESTLILPIKNR